MLGEIIISIMEWLGTVAFAVSGTLVAIGCSLDLFGVMTVGVVTAVGGGIVRDLLIGRTPPQIFSNPLIILLAILTSAVVFVVAYIRRKRFKSFRERIEKINICFDAIGLAAFSVAGVEAVSLSDYSDNALLAITLGVITGVGGGVLRDVLVNQKPYILTRHIYAVASIIGCTVYYVLSVCFDYKVVGTVVAILLTILIRLLAAKYRWSLPKIHFNEFE